MLPLYQLNVHRWWLSKSTKWMLFVHNIHRVGPISLLHKMSNKSVHFKCNLSMSCVVVYLRQQNILTYLHCGACFACSDSATSAGALFLKSVINFVRSNNIQWEICVDQSYEILSLLYYRDFFNLWREGYNIHIQLIILIWKSSDNNIIEYTISELCGGGGYTVHE